jgi:hypothetical protein
MGLRENEENSMPHTQTNSKFQVTNLFQPIERSQQKFTIDKLQKFNIKKNIVTVLVEPCHAVGCRNAEKTCSRLSCYRLNKPYTILCLYMCVGRVMKGSEMQMKLVWSENIRL